MGGYDCCVHADDFHRPTLFANYAKQGAPAARLTIKMSIPGGLNMIHSKLSC